jgi:acetylornithine deacetylase/succinyl-diaminopimelate desuccinylase-like protein
MRKACILLICLRTLLPAQTLEQRAQQFLIEMVRLAAVNPPGGETRVARYLEKVAKQYGIECELVGDNPERLNFVARLPGTGARRPLMLMAHSDVVPADAAQWVVPPFDAVQRYGMIYGRGTVDTLGLLAAEMSVLIECKKSGSRLSRDLILLSESDEEAGSTGMQWMIENAFPKIDAEFALNEGGGARTLPSGERVFAIQTAEKVPTRVVLKAHGTAGHGSLPRADNPVVHLSKAVTRLAEADQPVKLSTTTRRYFQTMSDLPGNEWLKPLLSDLDDPSRAQAAAATIRDREPEFAAQLCTTVSPTMLNAGLKINVIPNAATAELDVRRLPSETREEVYERFRKIINDPAVEVLPEQGQTMPSTEPSAMTTDLYRAMERVFRASVPRAVVTPFQVQGATDGSFLRAKGMAVYGVPVFEKMRPGLAHANDERIAVDDLHRGTQLLLKVVREAAQ